jgi:CubicO group peptidase (beta-lactamase class C family)
MFPAMAWRRALLGGLAGRIVNTRCRKAGGWLVVLIALAGGVAAAAAESGGSAAQEITAAQGIAAKMQEFIEQQRFSGGVVVVGRREGIFSQDLVGLRDIDAKLPMTNDTLFRIASMTKPITAIGVMILVDEGKLTVEDPVENYLPEFRGQMLVADRSGDTVVLKKPARPITVRDLLTHTSGVPAKFPEGVLEAGRQRSLTLAEAVTALSQRPLDFQPGTKWEYCSPGIDTLGRIVEVVSGQPFDTFLEQRIFTPLRMNDTTFYPREEQRGRTAVAYLREDGKLHAPQNSPSRSPAVVRYPAPAGGLYSSAPDMTRLCRMMVNGGELDGQRILSPASVRAMTSVQTDVVPGGKTEGLSAGLGWVVVRQPLGWTAMLSPGAYGHGGALGTQFWIDPQQGMFVILMFNRGNGSDAEILAIRGAVQAAAVAAVKAGRN